MLPAPRVLADGFVMIESGRWHDGRLWFAHWGAGEVLAVDWQVNPPGSRSGQDLDVEGHPLTVAVEVAR